MKRSWFVIIWTIIFIFLGIFIHAKTDELKSKYIDEFNKIEYNIINENWSTASDMVTATNNSLVEEKSCWYKLINHEYFNDIFMSIEILNQSIFLKEKMISLQEIERIKMILQNLEEDECCDLNRIF